jgi:hypothetical protein
VVCRKILLLNNLSIVQDCIARDEACLVEQGVLRDQQVATQSALAGCLVAGLQSDPEVAGFLGALTSLAFVIATTRLIWYQRHGLYGAVFLLDR